VIVYTVLLIELKLSFPDDLTVRELDAPWDGVGAILGRFDML